MTSNFRIDSVVNLDCNSEEYKAWLASLPPCGYIAPTLEVYNQQAQRITTLETALREIVAYDKQGGINSLVMRDIAKKALGEDKI